MLRILKLNVIHGIFLKYKIERESGLFRVLIDIYVLIFTLFYFSRVTEEHLMGSEKFTVDFVMGGLAAIISKSAAAPIERVKLLLQNQGEMLKRGQLKRPYNGVSDCFRRVLREEGIFSFWRGNHANVIRYFPTQVRIFILVPFIQIRSLLLLVVDIIIFSERCI